MEETGTSCSTSRCAWLVVTQGSNHFVCFLGLTNVVHMVEFVDLVLFRSHAIEDSVSQEPCREPTLNLKSAGAAVWEFVGWNPATIFYLFTTYGSVVLKMTVLRRKVVHVCSFCGQVTASALCGGTLRQCIIMCLLAYMGRWIYVVQG